MSPASCGTCATLSNAAPENDDSAEAAGFPAARRCRGSTRRELPGRLLAVTLDDGEGVRRRITTGQHPGDHPSADVRARIADSAALPVRRLPAPYRLQLR